MESESSQTLHRQQGSLQDQGPEKYQDDGQSSPFYLPCVQRNHSVCSTSSCWIWISACVMYCRERASTRETVEMKMWNKIFIFVFFAQKVFLWLCKITVDRLMSHGLLC